MKNELIKKLLPIVVIFSTFIYLGYNIGYDYGSIDGQIITLDTVSKILDKHAKLDTLTGNTAKFIIINPDTSIYIFNSKLLYK
jgi:hypothetical protein